MSSTQHSISGLLDLATKNSLPDFLFAVFHDRKYVAFICIFENEHPCCGVCYVTGAHWITTTEILGAICFWAKANYRGVVQFVIREDENPEKFLSWFKDLSFVSTVKFHNPKTKRILYFFSITL